MHKYFESMIFENIQNQTDFEANRCIVLEIITNL